jgi:hypothetical protein
VLLSRTFFFFYFLFAFFSSTFSQAQPTNPSYEITPELFATYQERLRKYGELAPFPELKAAVRVLEQKLTSPEVLEATKAEPTLERLRQMALTSLFHIDIEFRSEIHSDAYPIPFDKPFPLRPTLEAMDDGFDFLEAAEATRSNSRVLTIKLDAHRLNWFSLIKKIENKNRISSLSSFPPRQKTNISPEKEIIANPLGKYAEFHRRLKENGENSPFPEFQPTIDKLQQALESQKTKEASATLPVLEYLRQKAVRKLKEIKLEVPSSSRISKPFFESYPYRPTIHTIVDSLKFFDLLERSQFEENPDSQIVEESWMDKTQGVKKIEPLYHFDRYKYHWFGLISNPDVILFPTTEGLSFQDLIRVRAIPLGFLGVETVTHRVDRHYQTPLDFWYHDVNHVRRMVGYTLGRAKALGAQTFEEKFKVFESMDRQVRDLIKLIEIPPKPVIPESGLMNELDQKRAAHEMAHWESESAKKKMLRVLLFEILHESALSADRSSIIEDILRRPNTPQPFEYQSLSPHPIADIEDKRTDNGNLSSGSRQMRPFKTDNPTYIHYINDRALGLLANLYNKLQHGFYDSVYELKNYVVPAENRTPEKVAEAAELLLSALGAEMPKREDLVAWASSTRGNPEKFSKYKGISSVNPPKQTCQFSKLIKR